MKLLKDHTLLPLYTGDVEYESSWQGESKSHSGHFDLNFHMQLSKERDRLAGQCKLYRKNSSSGEIFWNNNFPNMKKYVSVCVYKFVPLTIYKWSLKPFRNTAFELQYTFSIIITCIKWNNVQHISKMKFSTDYRKSWAIFFTQIIVFML